MDFSQSLIIVGWALSGKQMSVNKPNVHHWSHWACLTCKKNGDVCLLFLFEVCRSRNVANYWLDLHNLRWKLAILKPAYSITIVYLNNLHLTFPRISKCKWSRAVSFEAKQKKKASLKNGLMFELKSWLKRIKVWLFPSFYYCALTLTRRGAFRSVFWYTWVNTHFPC